MNPIALVIAAEVFIPVFYRLQVKTTYEYLGIGLHQLLKLQGSSISSSSYD